MFELLNHFFGWVCGQNPDHTWAPGGLLLPCCQRCTGLYVGAAVATLLHWCCRPKLTARFLGVHALSFLVMVPCGLHWVAQTPAVRAGSGVLYGFAVIALLRAPLKQCTAGPAGGGWAYGAGLLTTLMVLPVLAQWGGAAVAELLSAGAFLGALAFGLTLLSVLATSLKGVSTSEHSGANEPREAFGVRAACRRFGRRWSVR